MPDLDPEAIKELGELFMGFIPPAFAMHRGMARKIIEGEISKQGHAEIKDDMLQIMGWCAWRILPKLDASELATNKERLCKIREAILDLRMDAC